MKFNKNYAQEDQKTQKRPFNYQPKLKHAKTTCENNDNFIPESNKLRNRIGSSHGNCNKTKNYSNRFGLHLFCSGDYPIIFPLFCIRLFF